MSNKESQQNKRPFIPYVYGYGAGLESEAEDGFGRALVEPTGTKGLQPHVTLAQVDNAVQYIERNYAKSASYWGAKFTLEPGFEEIPWHGPQVEMVFAKNAKALLIYAIFREFYCLLMMPEFWTSQYCVSIDAARHALFTVYPDGFQELPLADCLLTKGMSELEERKELTKLVWPAAERFNLVIDKIAEIVSGRAYWLRISREKAKLKQRASSATSLISGLLEHHKSLTVVAVRLSICQKHGSDFIGDKMIRALNSLIGDRRNDAYLSQSVGYFWVLQESFRARLKQRPSRLKNAQSVEGDIAVHYDLVMFFDAIHHRETETISRHIGEKWKAITNKVRTDKVTKDKPGFYRQLSGRIFAPHFARWVSWRKNQSGEFPPEADMVGLVQAGSLQAANLKIAAQVMAFSAALRKPKMQVGTLIKDGVHRFGKSDLLTGLGFDKAGRGNKLGRSDVKNERKKRPKYVPPSRPQI